MVEWVLAPAALFPYALGLLTIFYWCKKPKFPADDTNRINNIKSWWIGLTRPEVLAAKYKHLQKDVFEQIKGDQ